MTFDLAVGEYVKQLRRAGPRPSEHLVRHILQGGPGAVGPLLALALDNDLLHEDVPDCYAPIHALRLLGELRSTEIIAPLLRALPIEQEYPGEELPILWADEAAQMIGRQGVAAVEPLWAVVDDPEWDMAGRGMALAALTYATSVAPELRDEVVPEVLKRLGQSDDARLTAHLIAALAGLGAGPAYQQVMDLYRAHKVDTSIIPSATARQMLLAPGPASRLQCAQHPLWERYDRHGPHPEEKEN
jgi:hypothetical protein